MSCWCRPVESPTAHWSWAKFMLQDASGISKFPLQSRYCTYWEDCMEPSELLQNFFIFLGRCMSLQQLLRRWNTGVWFVQMNTHSAQRDISLCTTAFTSTYIVNIYCTMLIHILHIHHSRHKIIYHQYQFLVNEAHCTYNLIYVCNQLTWHADSPKPLPPIWSIWYW